MDTREVLLPKLLKQAGYTSAASLASGTWVSIGGFCRWPVASTTSTVSSTPASTTSRTSVTACRRCIATTQPTDEDKGTYCTYLFQREAVRFLNENHDRPFFLVRSLQRAAQRLESRSEDPQRRPGPGQVQSDVPRVAGQSGIRRADKIRQTGLVSQSRAATSRICCVHHLHG